MKKLNVRPIDKCTVPCFCCGECATVRMCIQDGPCQVNACLCIFCARKPADVIVAEMKGAS